MFFIPTLSVTLLRGVEYFSVKVYEIAENVSLTSRLVVLIKLFLFKKACKSVNLQSPCRKTRVRHWNLHVLQFLTDSFVFCKDYRDNGIIPLCFYKDCRDRCTLLTKKEPVNSDLRLDCSYFQPRLMLKTLLFVLNLFLM